MLLEAPWFSPFFFFNFAAALSLWNGGGRSDWPQSRVCAFQAMLMSSFSWCRATCSDHGLISSKLPLPISTSLTTRYVHIAANWGRERERERESERQRERERERERERDWGLEIGEGEGREAGLGTKRKYGDGVQNGVVRIGL